MKVNDLFMNVVKGKMVILDRERDIICRVDTDVSARCCYEVLRENDVLDDEVHFIEVVEDTMYITIK